ncbi:amidohydrolase family protein [Sphingomonas quercus]|nr:amidohydrolase family protein [Sphingomonas quercus]
MTHARAIFAVFALFPLFAATPVTAAPASPPSGAPRVDYHQHLVSPAFSRIVSLPVFDAAALIRRMDEAGVERAVVLSTGYSMADERKGLPDPDRLTREENDWTSAEVAGSGGRLVGFCGVNPLRDDALREIRRCLALPGMIGLKLHFGNSGVSLRNPRHLARMEEIFAAAGAAGAPVLVHMRARGGENFGGPDAALFIEHLLPRAAGSDVIVAHFGGAGPGYPEQADEVMAVFAAAVARHDPRLRRTWFDMATIFTPESSDEDAQRIARRIRQIGPSRTLYGSDLLVAPGMPSIGQTWGLITTRLGLSRSELRQIAGNRLSFIR